MKVYSKQVTHWVSVCALAFCALTMPFAAHGQAVAVAQVSGQVTDASGGAIAGARITATEIARGIVHAATSDSGGSYTLPNLPVGAYKLEVKTNGFKDFVENGLDLQVGTNVQINAAMQVGSVNETVEVTASAALVETRETSVAQVIDERRINDLPLNGRQATQLILISGGATYADSGDTGSKTFASSTRISVAGGQGNGTAYLLDGGDNTDAMSNVNLPFPFPDALEEFSVETSSVSSRFGTHPGATVNVVTKSGTNALHGDVFDYLRNGDLNARNFFAPKQDSLKRNQFGGVLGGRIIKDKLFFFGGYQGTRNRSNPPSSIIRIPNQAALTGDFSSLTSAACQSSGKPVFLLDPAQPAPPAGTAPGTAPYYFPNNVIPQSRLNPIASKIASSYLPATNDPCGQITYGIPITGDEDQEIGKVDWVKSDKQRVFVRYFTNSYQNPPIFDGKNLLTTTQPGNFERAQSATVGHTYVFGAGTLNSFHATFSRIRDNRGPTDTPISPTLLGVNIYSAVPNFLLLSVTGSFSTFCGTCAPGHFNDTSYQLADDIDVIRGRHEMSFGLNIVKTFNNTVSGFNENGNFTFNGSRTNLGMADFLLGTPSDFTQTNATPDDLRQYIMSFYAQDSFKLSKNITLNFGLRWEPTFSDPDKYKRGTSFSETAFLAGTHSTVIPNAPAGLFFVGDPGIPRALWQNHYKNFAPRVGMVFNPHGDGRDTIRLGGSILYDSTETWFNERETTNPPIGTALDIPNPAGGFTNPYQGFAGGSPFPTNGRSLFPNAGVYINMPITTNPTYVANWNLTYQRQFFKDWVFSASYLGNKTTHLWIAGEINPALYVPGNCVAGQYGLTAPGPCSTTGNPNFRRILYQANPTLGAAYASIDTADEGANAHYNGLIVSLQHRFAKNFTVLTNYTDSSCVSDYDFGAALAGSTNSQLFNRAADRGPCIFDVRRNFNLSVVANSPVLHNGLANKLLGGWQIAPLVRATSGSPMTVTTGTDNSRTGLNNDRPVQVLQDPYATSAGCAPAPCHLFLNAAAFTPNPIGGYGNVGRNAVRGPGGFFFDTSVSRVFKITERFNLEARGEAFNILNHTNFVGAISPAGTGTTYSTLTTALNNASFGKVNAAFDPRILQFALKMHF
jgi:hypothetical protein